MAARVVLARGRHRPKAATQVSEVSTLVATVAVAVVGASGGWVAWWSGRGKAREDEAGVHVDTADQVVAMVRAQLVELRVENEKLRSQMVADAEACEERAAVLAEKVDHLTREVGALRKQVRTLEGKGL